MFLEMPLLCSLDFDLVQQTIHHFGICRVTNDLGLTRIFVCFRGTGTFCFSATFLGFFPLQ